MEELLEKFNNIESFHWWWVGRREVVKRLIGKGTKKKIKILDIGCGTGETLNFLHQILPEAKLYGVDTSNLAVKFSKQNTKGKIYRAGALKLPFKKNTFDFILFLDVLEHINRDDKALIEAKRVLKKGGKIILTCPALSLIWSRHDTRQDHFRRYSRGQLMNLAKKTGMNVDFVNYYNFFLFLPILIIRVSSRLPFLKYLGKFDNSINYSIAKVGMFNNLLRRMILSEVVLMFLMKFPFGVSVVAKLGK